MSSPSAAAIAAHVGQPLSVEVERLANVHSHLREIPLAKDLIQLAFKGGADVILAMPNTKTELTTKPLVQAYTAALTSLVPDGKHMSFIPTAYLTETTKVEEILACVADGIVNFKVYPRFRTTQSEKGARNYFRIIQTVKVAAEEALLSFGVQIKVHVHPEHPSMIFGNRVAEYVFLVIADMLLNETEAIIIWEHGTDSDCIPHWKDFAKSERFHVTLTAHHLATDEDRTFGDVRAACKPPIKRAIDRELLVSLVCEGHSWLQAGGDDAPHGTAAKHVHEGQCACGAYTAPFLLQLYAHALDELLTNGRRSYETFMDFTSRNARRLHDLPESSSPVNLVRRRMQIPAHYQVDSLLVEPFWAGGELNWSIEEMPAVATN